MIELKGVDHLAFAVICDSREDALALGRRARRRIPSGVPIRVARVRDIPRNTMGKVIRPALKARLSEFFARADAGKP
jgi:acyl-coenzyme A synthetase/AMP-(fatty) acid ligase